MKKIILLMMTTILAGVIVTACGGSTEAGSGVVDTGSSGQTTLEIIMNDIYFGEDSDNINNPPTWTVKTGELVSVRAENVGVLDHNWAIVEAGTTLPDTIADPTTVENDLFFDVGTLAGGDSFNKPFTAPAAGTYTVICTVAGHYPAMQGILVVE